MIRNGNIPDLIKNENDKRIFVESINKIPFFANNPVTFTGYFGDERGNHKLIRHDETYLSTSVFDCQRSVMLRKFYNEYTVIGNYTWVDSNINIRNINSEYTIPNGLYRLIVFICFIIRYRMRFWFWFSIYFFTSWCISI